MSEDARPSTPPEGEQQTIVPETQEAAEELGSVAVGENPTKIAVKDGDPTTVDTRWDEDKARTVGMAAKESDTMDSSFRRQLTGVLDNDEMPIDDRAFDNEEITEQRVRQNHYDLVRNLRDAKYYIRDLEKKGQDVPEEAREELRQAQEAYDAVVPESRNVTSEYIEQSITARERVIEKLNSSFEELYEMNPELFAKMPTAEFIETRKELLNLENEISNSSEGLGNLATILDKLQKMIDEKRKIEFSTHYYNQGPDVTSRTIITTVGVALGALEKDIQGVESMAGNDGLYDYSHVFEVKPDDEDDKDFYDIRHKYIEEVHGDEFDKAPRQIMEDYKRITTEYLEQVRTKLEEAERRKQEFMAKYSKVSEVSPATEATS